MRLTADFLGEAIRFEGDRTVAIDGLPEGAQIKQAAITLSPVAAPGRPLFEEVLTFTGSVGDFGMTKVSQVITINDEVQSVVEVNFHARRTLAAVRGPNVEGSGLLVDLGGGVFYGDQRAWWVTRLGRRRTVYNTFQPRTAGPHRQ
jgi:hypothetical protein